MNKHRNIGEKLSNIFERDKINRDENTLFSMADYCNVLLYAHMIREAGEDFESELARKFIPLIMPGKLHNMPEEVAVEMDRILQRALTEIEGMADNVAGFFESLESGEYDPVREMVNSPEMVQAMGNVMMRKLSVTEGVRGDAAFERARLLMPEVKQEMLKFVGGMLMHAIMEIGSDADQKGIPLSRVSEVIKPRVVKIAEQGCMIESAIDKRILKKIAQENQDEKPDKTKFDPSYI